MKTELILTLDDSELKQAIADFVSTRGYSVASDTSERPGIVIKEDYDEGVGTDDPPHFVEVSVIKK